MKLNVTKLRRTAKAQYEHPEMSSEQVERLKLTIEQAKQENRKARKHAVRTRITAAAAIIVVMLFVLPNTSKTIALAMQQIPLLGDFIKLITVKDYQYEDKWHDAEIMVGELVLEDISGIETMDSSVKKELEKTIAGINKEIRTISENMLDSFVGTVEGGYGPQSTYVKSEILPSTEHYLIVKLNCFTAEGSGIAWNYYYTIDLSTGKQMVLADLFREGVDYITPISENIMEQMKQQVQDDENKSFSPLEELNPLNLAEAIQERQAFYINEKGNVVICFDEGEVAAMYMGDLEFEIDNEVLKNIRK
ncbi:MAG: DUF3298 domain-containing protein [Lachnospiraceae bacterium]|nr:DUF3298 domain-containing protein [Lachnospiraceae bacterium]